MGKYYIVCITFFVFNDNWMHYKNEWDKRDVEVSVPNHDFWEEMFEKQANNICYDEQKGEKLLHFRTFVHISKTVIC